MRPPSLPVPLAIALAACTAAAPVAGQERLHLDTIGDLALYRLGLQVHEDPVRFELEGGAGLDGSLARGAAPSPDRPLGLTWALGFAMRGGPGALLQIRSEGGFPLPLGPGPRDFTQWDVEGAHRAHGQLALGGLDGDKLKKGRGGVDVEVDASLWMSGRYSTSFVRRDVGPYPFMDAGGTATVAPRLAVEREIAIVLPVSVETRELDVDRPEGVFSVARTRVSSGLGVKPFTEKLSHGLVEIVGAGWEEARFSPPPGAPRPKLGGVERFDLRLLHMDHLVFSPDKDVELSLSSDLGGNWLHDTAGAASLSTFAAAFSVAVRGYPDYHKEEERTELALGFGGVRDAIFMADGSALTKHFKLEGFFDTTFLDHRFGGSLRGSAEQLTDLDPKNHFRGAVAAEWYLTPAKPLQVGVHFTSSELCASPAAAAGPAWCHRFGVFLRADGRGEWTRKK